MTTRAWHDDLTDSGRCLRILIASAIVSAGCGAPVPESAASPGSLSIGRIAVIGSDAGQERTPLGRVADLEIGADGSVFVLDALTRSISVFDSVGAPVRVFGRRGQGPGEMEEPAALVWGPEGNLWVADVGIGRLTVFEPGGDLVTTYQASGPPAFRPPALGFTDTGRLRSVGIDLPGGSLELMRLVLVEYELEEAEARPVEQTDLPFVEWPELYEYRGDDVVLILPVPFSPQPIFGLDPGGRFWYAQAGEGLIHRLSSSGGFDRTLQADVEPVRVTAAEVASILEGSPDFEELQSLAGPAAVEELTGLIPEFRPPIDGFFFDDRANVWTMRGVTEQGGRTHIVDVYGSRETIVATGRLDLVVDPRPRVRDGVLVGVARDDLGVESVVLYRIEIPPGS